MGWREWIRTVEIEPAIDAARAPALERQVEALLRTGCRIFHVNGAGATLVEAVALLAPLVHRYEGVLDVHSAGAGVAALAAAGADSVTVASAEAAATVAAARAAALPVGVALPPELPAAEAAALAGGADLVLCACDGPDAVERVRRVAAALPPGVVLQVEGAVGHENVRSLYRAGARLLVADEPIFAREDLPRAYRRLVQALA